MIFVLYVLKGDRLSDIRLARSLLQDRGYVVVLKRNFSKMFDKKEVNICDSFLNSNMRII